MNANHFGKRFTCDICQATFKDRSTINQHMKKVHPEIQKEYSCETCPKVFKYHYSLEEHVRNQHNAEVISKGTSHANVSTQRSKKLMTSASKAHKCTDCPMEFTSQLRLKKHVKKVHSRTGSGTMTSARSLKIRTGIRSKTVNSSGKIFKCDSCLKEFTNRNSFRQHVKATHQGLKHKCELCEATYTYKTHLQDHMNEKHLGKVLPCDLCQATFKARWAIRKHMKRAHPDVQNEYSCEQCPKVFKYHYSWEDHVKNQHSDTDASKTKIGTNKVQIKKMNKRDGSGTKISTRKSRRNTNP